MPRREAAFRAGQDATPAQNGGSRLRAVVCLPTYNERENLEPMVRALSEVIDTQTDRVLVIDDSSPDGSGAIADRLCDELPWVSVLHRPRKEGLGPAYLAGFRWALRADAELVLEVDCDFSHDPADVPRLIAACAGGADLAIGSRYVEGGGTRNWGWSRRIVSRVGARYARTVLRIHVRDVTGGFKCFTRSALESIDLAAIDTKGYAFQIETTFRVLRAGGRVEEVPIVFTDRVAGGSKMSAVIALEAVWRVPLLRLRALSGRL